ncbi:NAD-dependent epimerase/dehydratase family protein [Lachnotalea glycerini]|uniref:NAD-dependent epimerase/dehydratase family protein n=1 Tax=Lachnotalea glycerini TaxID=1763509 RepID=A0A371JC67_9FIRM|nr:NAD-dependent epimerase/dehydratase family protein [Lachnotalea glycerini]RDY30332.1 NAD-dependent epimerase/dehydratase family protein [Lachnotalea glycerini]
MKVLLIGEGCVEGRYIAARLYKEGHKINWIAKDSTQQLFDNEVKANIYHVPIASSRCKEVIKSNSIDTIIYLTSGYRERFEKEEVEYDSLIPDLHAVLKYSVEYNSIKRIVFMSSVELADENNLLPILTDLKAGEMLCDAFSRKYQIPIAVLRVSSVYGEEFYDRAGYLGKVIGKMKEGKRISTTFSPSAEMDLIYGGDVADALYRVLIENKTGTFVATSEKPIKITEFFKVLSQRYNYSFEIQYAQDDGRELKSCKADRLKGELGWLPIHEFLKELNSLDQIDELNKTKRVMQVREDKIESKYIKFLRNLFENILLFLLAILFKKFANDYSDLRFIDVRLMYVVMVGMVYGVKQGLISTVLASVSYIYDLSTSNIDISFLLYSISSWMPIVFYMIAGAWTGYLTDKRIDEMESEKEEHSMLIEKYQFLRSLYNEMREVKEQLQKQILVSKDSFGRVYEIANELSNFKPELIMFKAIRIIENIMETESVALYMVANDNFNYARLMANSVNLKGKLTSTLKLDQLPGLKKAMENREFFVNTELNSDYPAYAMPIVDQDKVVAVAMIYKLDYNKYSTFYQNLYRIVIGLIQQQLVNAYKYNEAMIHENYIEGTVINSNKEFEDKLQTVESAKEELDFNYLLVKVWDDNSKIELNDFSDKVKRIMRNTDFAGINSKGEYNIVFMQATKNDFSEIQKRFLKVGLNITMEEIAVE